MWQMPPLPRSQRLSDQTLCLVLNPAQMVGAFETLGVYFVNVLGAGWPRGKPTSPRHHLEAAERSPVARRDGQHAFDGVAGQILFVDLFGRERCQPRLLLRRGRSVDPLIHRRTELLGQARVDLP